MISKISNVTHNLAGLPAEVHISKAVRHDHSTELFISYPRPLDSPCPSCGSSHSVSKGKARPITVRHSAAADGSGILLTFSPYRFTCKDCGRSFTVRPYFIHPSLSISSHLFLSIFSRLNGTVASVHDVAVNTFSTNDIVLSVMKELVQDWDVRLPQTICIDEFKGSSGSWNPARKRYDTYKYHCNISDADLGAVLDVLPTIDHGSLRDYFFRFPLEERSKVRFICCDMHAGFAKLASSCFPRAVVCYDNFHVIRLLNQRMDDLRVRIQNAFRFQGDIASYTILKHSSRLLTTAEQNQETYWKNHARQKLRRLERIFDLAPDIRCMYDALQDFHTIFREPQFSIQRLLLSKWISQYLSSEVPELRRAARSIQRFRKGILNAWKYGKSNASCEGLNRRIKEIKRNACGMHDFENFRMRVLLACGPVRMEHSTHALTNEKNKNKEA